MTIHRKHDKWMVPFLIAFIPLFIGSVVTGAMWAKATDKDIKANALLSNNNQQHIVYLEKCASDEKMKNSVIDAKVNNILSEVGKIGTRQEKILDMIIEILKKEGHNTRGK